MTKQGEVRDWHKDMELCQQLNEWYEHPWQAGQEEGTRVIEIYEIIPDEPCNFVAECDSDLTTNFIMESRQALPYWLQQYAAEKEQAELWREHVRKTNLELETVEAREKKLREAIEETINEALTLDDAIAFLNSVLASLYPKEEEA